MIMRRKGLGFALKDFLGIVLAVLVGGIIMYAIIMITSHYSNDTGLGALDSFKGFFDSFA